MAEFQEQLEHFVEHFEEMQRSSDSDDIFNQEFMALKAQSQQLKEQEKYSTDSGQLAVNKKKNRFKDILPFEYTRVVLPSIGGVDGSDYINANYIKGYNGKRAYIAAQGPLPNTVNDFVRMLWENNTEIIMMACREVEMGKHKCHAYWAGLNEEVAFGEILIKTTKEENISNDFVVRDLVLVCCGVEKAMRQYHYTAWPDHGVPTSAEPIIRMIEMARECQTKADTPVVVHCSAGCGRTGTILVVDYIRSLLLSKSLPKDLSVYGLVEQMRMQRPAMVQAKDQYFFVYIACAELAKRVLGNKPQPPRKNEDTISTLKRAPSSQPNNESVIYENRPLPETSDSSPPILPRQNSVKSSAVQFPPPAPPKPKLAKSNSTLLPPSTPSSSSSLQLDTSAPGSGPRAYEMVVAPDSPVPRAAPRVKRSITPQSLDKGDEGRDTKKLPMPLPSEVGGPPKSPTFPTKVPSRRETPRTEEKTPVKSNKGTPKMMETPKSGGKSILDVLMAECDTDIMVAAGVNEEDGVKVERPISFSVDTTDAPDLPSRTPNSMELIPSLPATPTTPASVPETKAKPLSGSNGIYEQPTLWSVLVSKIVPPVVPSGCSPHSTLSPSSSITAFGTISSSNGSKAALLSTKNSIKASKVAESDTTESVKLRTDTRFPVVSNMSATGSVVTIPSGPLGFGVRVGKPRGPRSPPSHWKMVPIVL